MNNFDKKIGLGAQLANLQGRKEDLELMKEKAPYLLIRSNDKMERLESLVYTDKKAWETIKTLCTNILDVYIGAIDRRFAELKAEFESL